MMGDTSTIKYFGIYIAQRGELQDRIQTFRICKTGSCKQTPPNCQQMENKIHVIHVCLCILVTTSIASDSQSQSYFLFESAIGSGFESARIGSSAVAESKTTSVIYYTYILLLDGDRNINNTAVYL